MANKYSAATDDSSRAYERLNDTVGTELPDSVIRKVMDAQHEDRAAGRDKVSITMWKRAPGSCPQYHMRYTE